MGSPVPSVVSAGAHSQRSEGQQQFQTTARSWATTLETQSRLGSGLSLFELGQAFQSGPGVLGEAGGGRAMGPIAQEMLRSGIAGQFQCLDGTHLCDLDR